MTRNRNSIQNLMILIIFGLFIVSCTLQRDDGITEQIVNGVWERIYHDPIPPVTDPYTIEVGVVYGTDQSEDTYLLTIASPRVFTDDGMLYVLDARQTQAHRFAPDGTYISSFGRRGQGPGEFSLLQDLTLDEGRLYTNDPFNRRVTVMNLDGSLIEVVTFPDETPVSRLVVPYRFNDDRGYLLIDNDVQIPYIQGAIPQARFLVVQLNDALEITRTLIDSTLTFTTTTLGERPMQPPFDNLVPATGIAPGMPIAWSYGTEFRIDFMDPDDLKRWAVTIPHMALSLSNELREQQIEFFDSLSRSNDTRRKMSFPDQLPHLDSMDDLKWDTAGRLWVQEYRDRTSTDSPFRFYVFSQDGKWLFRQDLVKKPMLITGEGYYSRVSAEDGTPLVQFNRFVAK